MRVLADIGERGIIKIIENILSRGSEVVGIGDDCAAFEFQGEYLLVSTDMVTRSTHLPVEMKPWEIGWFITAVTLSDIAAKGGSPLGMVLSLGLPRETTEDFIIELMRGADSCIRKYGASIVGGDTKENEELTLCGTALGVVPKNEFMGRKGLQVGDVLAVTGVLGKAAAGYLSLQSGILDENVRKGLFQPHPRIWEGRSLSKSNRVHACMDLSDGLSASLYQLMELNGLGFEVDAEKIPIADALLRISRDIKFNALDYALHFGGDYELLIATTDSSLSYLKEELASLGSSLTEIGVVRGDRRILLRKNGNLVPLENLGYEHFKPHHLLQG